MVAFFCIRRADFMNEKLTIFEIILMYLSIIYISYLYKFFCWFIGVVQQMKEWLFHQVYDFNVIIFISIMIFNVGLSKNNTSKLIQEQSKELYLEIEEVKDEIRELKK